MSRGHGRTLIVFFHPGHPNHSGMLKYVKPALAARGYSFEEISYRDPGALVRLACLLASRRDEIFCLYSVNFYIKELALRNVWLAPPNEPAPVSDVELYLHQLTGIPLVVHIYDHPLYLLKHESAAFDGAIVFVNGDDIIDFMRKHLQSTYTYVPIPVPTDVDMPALIPSRGEPEIAEFLARRNAIWCPMNLSVQNLTVDGHWARIKGLPAARRARANRLLDLALYDCTTPLHVISEQLTAAGDAEIAVSDQLHVANFIKLWRRTTMIRALIELPIVVSSDFVPADLERKYPHKFTHTSMEETLAQYNLFRFSLNSFPLHSEALHDRVINPFFANCVLVTDRNALSVRLFEDGVDLVFLDYVGSDMAAKLRPYLEQPEMAYQITLSRYRRRIEREQLLTQDTPRAELCDGLIDAVKAAWMSRETASGRRGAPDSLQQVPPGAIDGQRPSDLRS